MMVVERTLLLGLLASWLCLSPTESAAQSRAAQSRPDPPSEASPVAERLRFRHLTPEDGLAHGVVVSILQDSRGFMWFGTWGGLNRFDGYDFKEYAHRPGDPASLAGDVVNALVEDREGFIWAGTGTGLSRLDVATQSFTNFLHDPDEPHSLGGNDVWSLLEDRDGDLWVLTLGGGLNRLDRDSGRFQRFLHDPDDPATLSSDTGRALFEDHLGELWIGTQLDGLNRLERDSGRVRRYRHHPDDPDSLSGDDVWSVYEDRFGVLWVGTRTRGLNRYDRDRDRFVRYPAGPATGLHGAFVFTLHEDHAGTLWVGTFDGGLHRYERENDRFLVYRPVDADPESLSHFQITELFTDASGGLWVATFGYGVDRLDRNSPPIGLYEPDPANPESLGGKDVRAVHEDADGVLWIGTYDGGLTRFDPAQARWTHYRHDPNDPRSLSDDRIHVIHEDRRRDLWIGTWGGGVDKLERATGSFEHYRHDPADPASLSENDVRGLYEAPDGALWIATRASGLDRLEPGTGEIVRHPPEREDAERLDEHLIFTTLGTDAGILWVGLWGGGLNRFDVETGRVRRYRATAGDPDAISSDEVWAIHRDADGYLWLGTNSGLNRFDPRSETFVAYHEADGLADDAVYDVVADERGRLWLTTSVGISRFDPRTGKFRNFDAADGIQKTSFVDGCAYRSGSGEIFIGGKLGLHYFHPDDIAEPTYVPPVVLTDFRIFNEPVEIGAAGSPLARDIADTDRITLTSGQSVFTIGFSALDYRYPEGHLYAYKLEPLEEKWNEVDSRRRYATYTNLDPGRYTFRVRGATKDGPWNDAGRSLEIRVLPPLWGTWWFHGLAAVVITALVWVAYWLRTSSIRAHSRALEAEIRVRRRAEKERERLIGELGSKNEQLETQNAELERFTYTVSHDLKAPLFTISGYLGMLEKDVATGDVEAARRDADVIRDAAGEMRHLLDDLLELSRIGRVINPPEAVELAELVDEATDRVAGAIVERGVEVHVEEPMPKVWGDRVRLLEVFQNLLDNAVKFMGSQPSPRIEVSASENASHVRCSIRDNGIGIAARHHGSIFGLFDRLDPSIEGTGVGLTLVKRIVEVHGGEIRVESPGEGQGTTFVFTLPRADRCP